MAIVETGAIILAAIAAVPLLLLLEGHLLVGSLRARPFGQTDLLVVPTGVILVSCLGAQHESVATQGDLIGWRLYGAKLSHMVSERVGLAAI